jgi:RNA polymerase II subunit A small phosphatase-like protein
MTRRILLVLDLDETLIHSSPRILETNPAFEFNGQYVYRRPHLEEFIAFAFDRFEVGVWTSAGNIYADAIVAEVFGSRKPAFVWCSDRCTHRRIIELDEPVSLKRLSKLKSLGYSMDRILAVDDSPEKHSDNYGNLIQVSEFVGDPNDMELRHLRLYLATISEGGNVRGIEKRGWRARTLATHPV